MKSTGRFPIFHNGKWGYIDRNAAIVIKPQFDDAGRFSDGLANVRIDDECGYIDPSGKIVIDLQFEEAFDFTEGLAAVSVVNRSLFQAESTFQLDLDEGILPSGLRQQFEYTGIVLPQNTLVEIVEQGEEWTITDPLNAHTYFVEEDGDVLDVYIKGRTQAERQLPDYKKLEKTGGEWGYIDKTGEFVIEPQFVNAAPFSEGLARVKIENRWGYIDKTGELIIPAIFNNASDFSEGLAGVETTALSSAMARPKKAKSYLIYAAYLLSKLGLLRGAGAMTSGTKYGFIDRTGEIVIAPQYESVFNFSEGLACVRAQVGLSTKCGYVDRYGNMVIDPQFRWANRFSEGLASVEIKGKRGYINKRSGVMIKPQFDDAASFSEGLAVVEIDGKFGYMNSTGQFIIAPQFDWAEDFSDGLALVVVDGRQGYIDQTGNYI